MDNNVNGLITFDIHHGGKFTKENTYIGGKVELGTDFDSANLTFDKLELFVKHLGYHSAVKYALKDMSEDEPYFFFDDEDSFCDCISVHIDKSKSLKLYIEAITADLTENDVVDVVPQSSNILEHDVGSSSTLPEFDEKYYSEYASSDASLDSLDSNDESDFIRSKSKTKEMVYSSNCDHKTLIFDIGMKFKDYKECKEAVRMWAILNGYNIKWYKSSRDRLGAKCEEGCPWKLYASKLAGEPTFVIKIYIDGHTCMRSMYNRQVNAEWLANRILPTLKRNTQYAAKDMMTDVQLQYEVKVNKSLCYKARTKALTQIRGSFDSHYSKLRSYVAELRKMDMQRRFELKTFLNANDQPVFERIYIGFSGLKNGFQVGCRTLIGFDACFLKTALGGALLAAVGKDCNDKMYPISWAVVEKENEATWSWFFEKLFEDLNISDGYGWTFMSDKQKGLINGIQKLAPNAEHRHCARHVYANWKKQFPGPKYHYLFWKAVKCTTEAQFNEAMSEIKAESVMAYEEFHSRQPRSFCKSLISPHTKTDVVENNICEAFNSYILNSRDKPIIEMLQDIRLHLMTRICDIANSLQSSGDILCPNVRSKIVEIQKMVKHCMLKPALGSKYEVHFKDDSCIVDLVNRECTCKSWMLTGIPCFHALACIIHVRDDISRYVDAFYYRENCLNAYKFGLNPIHGPKEWPPVHEPSILPPPYVQQPGRPKKNRIRDLHEDPKPSRNKLSKMGIKMSCRKCGKFGHNTRTCKEEHAMPEKPKGKVGRPKKPRPPTTQLERRQKNQHYGARTNAKSTADEGSSQRSEVFDERTQPPAS